MQAQGVKGRYIKQIKLAGSKQYFPNRFFSPYQFMDGLNQAVRKKYQIKVVEVRYIISKSKSIKDMDDHTGFANLVPEAEFNNVFSIKNDFMDFLMKDTILLVPPEDFDPSKFEEQTNAAKKQFEEKKNEEIDVSLKLLTDIYSLQNPKEWKGKQLKSLTRFKKQISPAMKQSQVDIYIKAVMSKPTEDRIENDKNSKSPIVVNTQSKQQVRVYLHPVKNDSQSQDLIAKQFAITDWSLCTFAPNSNDGSTYWSVRDIAKKTQEINGSIKIINYIAVHKNKKGNIDYFEVYSFLFNQIVLKVVINLAQIKKVQIYDSKRSQKPSQQEQFQYYLHLAYPPRYYMSILKPDVGCDDGFIRNWQRIENFTFLRNESIMKDQFLRLYLFNNTIFKIRLCKNDLDINVEHAKNLINNTISLFKGTIKTQTIPNSYDFGRRLTNLTTVFKYKNFKDKFQYSLTSNFTEDKIWKLKYLILVEIRHNRILPSQIQSILNRIEQSKEDIDIYIYIFWQNVALLTTVSPQGNRKDYLPLLQLQFNQIKKLSISDITRKVSSNTDLITYIFRASLTPSGYLYDPPTPEMKGRLMKEYSYRSEHFMRVSISDDNEGTLKNQKYITKIVLREMMKKIPILERNFIPLGWSPSQLRSYSLWYIHQVTSQKRLTRPLVLSFLGDFTKIDNPAKKAARIGQSFSSSWTYECKNGQIKEVEIADDLSTRGYMYTDGIGKISADLLERISLKLHIKDLTVVQIRYKGAKGILVLDSNLPKRTVHLRPSMIKYQCLHDAAAKYLDILDWNKYKAGFLNRQTIVLLKSLGISDKVFEKRHYDHILKLNNLSFKDCSIFKHMNEELNTDINNLQPANVTILHLLRAGFKLENQPFFRGVLQTMKKNGYHQLKVKCNIMIEKSARIIGIIDEWDILKEGQLYCTVQDSLSMHPKKEHVQGNVIITRNPCLHPADIRKMKCISNQQVSARFEEKGLQNLFINYVNCVIFPKKGEIPVTSQISGSDLDGDNFFISWDPQLIPQRDQPCYVIDNPTSTSDKKSAKESALKSEQETYNEMLNFFVEYLNYEKLGQIDNSHLVHADRSPFYAKAAQCIELAVAHGKAVDFPKSGFCPEIDPKLLVSTYPDFMEKQQSPEYTSESIIGRLYRDIKERITNLLSSCQTHKTGKIDDELVQQLVKTQNFVFQSSEIKEAIEMLLNYEKQLSGLINLVGVDTEYEIYSGNFSIAKDKVKAFGKNRLIATILTLRSKYFDQFFNNARSQDKQIYIQATENNLQRHNLFVPQTRRKALLYYTCSYLMKYNEDEDFLNNQYFRPLRQSILSQFKGMSYNREGKFCGFVWFIIPKIIINQKYRIKKLAVISQQLSKNPNKEEQDIANAQIQQQQQEAI